MKNTSETINLGLNADCKMTEDNLRRSKRKKFHLDVAAMHLIHPERRKTLPHIMHGRCSEGSPLEERSCSLSPAPCTSASTTCSSTTSSLSNNAGDEMTQATQTSPDAMDVDDTAQKASSSTFESVSTPSASSATPSGTEGSEDSKRQRRTPRHTNYVFEDSDDDDLDTRGMIGSHPCVSCPARFETRPGLANHAKLHGVEKRKYSCEMCDFSCGTMKALRNHNHCHAVHFQRIVTTPSPPSYQSVPSKDSAKEKNGNSSVESTVKTVPDRQTAAVLESTAGAKEPKCSECPFQSSDKKKLEKHRRCHRKSTGFLCSLCSFKSQTCGSLRVHMELHDIRPPPLWFPRFLSGNQTFNGHVHRTCDIATRRAMAGISVGRRRAAGDSGWRCPGTDCVFENRLRTVLVWHKRRKHKQEMKDSRGKIVCSCCELRLPSIYKLKVHRLLCHSYSLKKRVKRKFMKEAIETFFRQDAFRVSLPRRARARGRGLKNKKDTCDEEDYTMCEDEDLPEEKYDNNEVLTPKTPVTLKEEIKHEPIESPCTPDTASVSDDGLIFKCSYCPYKANSRSRKERHETKHQVKAENMCRHCSFSCRDASMIEQHERLHELSAVPKLYTSPIVSLKVNGNLSTENICSKCGFHSMDKKLLVQHERLHLAESTKVETPSLFPHVPHDACNTPIREFLARGGLPYLPIGPFLPLAITVSTYKELSVLCDGLGEVEDQASPYESEEMKTRGKLNGAHLARKFIGKDGKQWRQCIDCPYATKFGCDMVTHRDMHNNVASKYRCSQCSYGSLRLISLRAHLDQHAKQNEQMIEKYSMLPQEVYACGYHIGIRKRGGPVDIYSCHKCPFVSRQLETLWKHVRHHIFATGRSFLCSTCGFGAHTMGQLTEHMAVHPDGEATVIKQMIQKEVKPVNRSKISKHTYKCKDCPFIGTTYQRWWMHNKKHAAVSKFRCHHCTFSVGSQHAMREHFLLHKTSEDKTEGFCRVQTTKLSDETTKISDQSPVDVKESHEIHRDHRDSPKLGQTPSILTPLRTPLPKTPTTPVLKTSASTSKLSSVGKRCASRQLLTVDLSSSSDDSAKPSPFPLEPSPSPEFDLAVLDPVFAESSPAVPEISETLAASLKCFDMPPLPLILRKQMEEFRIEREVFSCMECPYTGRDPVDIALHKKAHQESSRHRNHQCPLCTFSTNSAEVMIEHVNLHQPPKNSLPNFSRRSLSRRRTANDVCSGGVGDFKCRRCNFSTAEAEAHYEHMHMHAQSMLSRLTTLLKRNGSDADSVRRSLLSKHMNKNVREPGPMNWCSDCDFRCEDPGTHSLHREFHNKKNRYTCRLCSYSAAIKATVDFHESKHHSQQPLTNIAKFSRAAPHLKMNVSRVSGDEEEEIFVRKYGLEARCTRCSFVALDMFSISKHWDEKHKESKEDRRMAEFLYMDLVPATSTEVVA